VGAGAIGEGLVDAGEVAMGKESGGVAGQAEVKWKVKRQGAAVGGDGVGEVAVE
jgi:hypothetical protein